MAKKKLEVIKNMSAKELTQKIAETQKTLFEGKIRLATGQLENTSSLWKARKDVARLKTFLTQKTASK